MIPLLLYWGSALRFPWELPSSDSIHDRLKNVWFSPFCGTLNKNTVILEVWMQFSSRLPLPGCWIHWSITHWSLYSCKTVFYLIWQPGHSGWLSKDTDIHFPKNNLAAEVSKGSIHSVVSICLHHDILRFFSHKLYFLQIDFQAEDIETWSQFILDWFKS